jgi:hypothetical protein
MIELVVDCFKAVLFAIPVVTLIYGIRQIWEKSAEHTHFSIDAAPKRSSESVTGGMYISPFQSTKR